MDVGQTVEVDHVMNPEHLAAFDFEFIGLKTPENEKFPLRSTVTIQYVVLLTARTRRRQWSTPLTRMPGADGIKISHTWRPSVKGSFQSAGQVASATIADRVKMIG